MTGLYVDQVRELPRVVRVALKSCGIVVGSDPEVEVLKCLKPEVDLEGVQVLGRACDQVFS